jgi:ribosomal protein S27AE
VEKFGVDEGGSENEKLAAQGCPKCGSEVKRHGNILVCPQCGTEPFEKKKE